MHFLQSSHIKNLVRVNDRAIHKNVKNRKRGDGSLASFSLSWYNIEKNRDDYNAKNSKTEK